jgi:hypothetical protein
MISVERKLLGLFFCYFRANFKTYINLFVALRLIEKYFHDKKSAPVSMVTMIFESKVVKQDSDSNGNQIWIPDKYSKII